MKTTLLSILFLLRGFCWAQQLEFQYTSQQLNVYNSLTTDIPIFTQNFDDQVSGAIPIVPFTIGGQAYNMLFVSANGFLTLGQAASTTNYNPISQPPGTPVVAPFACNLESANNNARISYQIINGFNNAPTSIIIQWKKIGGNKERMISPDSLKTIGVGKTKGTSGIFLTPEKHWIHLEGMGRKYFFYEEVSPSQSQKLMSFLKKNYTGFRFSENIFG